MHIGEGPLNLPIQLHEFHVLLVALQLPIVHILKILRADVSIIPSTQESQPGLERQSLAVC